MDSIVLFLVASVAVCLTAGFLASRLLPRQPLAGSLLFLVLVLVQITLIGLAAGIGGVLSPVSLCLGAIVLGMVLVFGSQVNQFRQEKEPTQAEAFQVLNLRGMVILVLLLLVGLLPFSGLLGDWVRQLRQVHPLSWDVVSYHLPNVLDYLQSRSLWTIQGPYGHYPGGNELLQLWSFIPLRLDSLLGFTTASLVLGVLLVSTLLLHTVLADRPAFERGVCTILLWLVCLAVPTFQDLLFDLGRNDITLTFWQLVALWGLVRAAQAPQHPRGWLLLTGISVGMAIGIKPNGLYYLPGLAALILLPGFPALDGQQPRLSKLRAILVDLVLPALLLGGFWYLRNLLRLGRLSPPEQLQAAANLSIARNLLNPALYQPNVPLLFCLFCLVVTGLTLLLRRSQPGRATLPLGLLAGFNAIALLALILIPSGAGYLAGSSQVFLIQLRYSAALIPVTMILALALLMQLWEQWQAGRPELPALLARFQRLATPNSTSRTIAALMGLGALVLALQISTYRPPQGLPGQEGIVFPGGGPASQVYAWVQQHVADQTIYAVGLRPYGLYGFPFRNRVVYELSSEGWQYDHGLAMLRRFRPQYIVICVDPFSRTAPQDLARLAQQPQAFPVVYVDPLAIVFRVTPAGQALADRV